jgi:hypothetical protein
MVIYSGWHGLVWAFKESQQRVLLPIFTAFPFETLLLPSKKPYKDMALKK